MSIDEDSKHSVNIDHLPYDVLLHILRILPSRDLVHLLSSCRALHALIAEESIWRSLSSAYGITTLIYFGGRSWYTLYTRLLQPYTPMLGLWAGDHAYTGDVLDVRLCVGDSDRPGGIVVGCWRFPPVQLEDLDGPEMPENPIYMPLIHIGLPSGAAPGGVNISCCTTSGETPPHQAYIEVFSPTSQSLFLHTRQGRYPHPEFPHADIMPCIDHSRYPQLPLRDSIVVDQVSDLSLNPRGYVVFSAPTNQLKPSAISISCSLGCVERARAFHGFQEDVPYLPRYYPLRRFHRAGIDPASPEWHPSSLDGLWLGSHGPHGTECLVFRWDSTSSTLRAWKITGDSNVPRGALSWRANTSNSYPGSQLPDWIYEHEIPNLAKSLFFAGTGCISARGFLPYHKAEMDIILVVCGADEIRTAWMDSGDVAAYIRHRR